MLNSALDWKCRAHGYAECRATIALNTASGCRVSLHNERGRVGGVLAVPGDDVALDTFYRRPLLIDGIRNGPGGEHVDRFAEALAEDGYRRRHGYGLLEAARHLAQWAHREGKPLAELTAEDLAQFSVHAARCTCLDGPPGRKPANAKKRARVFLRYVQRGRLGDRRFSIPPPPPRLVQEFLRWMGQNRGVKQSTLDGYQHLLGKMIAGLGDDPKKYTAATVRRFVVEYGTAHSPVATKAIVNVLRAFIRFLTVEGLCSDSLGAAVPHFRCPPAEPLPAVLSAEEIRKVLDATKPTGLVGIRNRAVLLLLLRLGLRVGDVSTLRFSDVLWERGLLRLSGKGRRESCIPLPQEVGDALLAYLEVRPKVATDVIFLRVLAPARPFATAHAVTSIARHALRRAGIQNPAPHRQLFRHTAATHLARARLRPESIATILRHRSLSMTAHYTHANPRALKGVIQRWPLTLPR